MSRAPKGRRKLGVRTKPTVPMTLPVEIYSDARVREFDEGEAELKKLLDRKKKKTAR